MELGPDAGTILKYGAGDVNINMKLAIVSITVRECPDPVCAGEGEAPGDAVVICYLYEYCGVVYTQYQVCGTFRSMFEKPIIRLAFHS